MFNHYRAANTESIVSNRDMATNTEPVGAAEGCDLLILKLYAQPKCRLSARLKLSCTPNTSGITEANLSKS